MSIFVFDTFLNKSANTKKSAQTHCSGESDSPAFSSKRELDQNNSQNKEPHEVVIQTMDGGDEQGEISQYSNFVQLT